jgi:hypothetical protein
MLFYSVGGEGGIRLCILLPDPIIFFYSFDQFS